MKLKKQLFFIYSFMISVLSFGQNTFNSFNNQSVCSGTTLNYNVKTSATAIIQFNKANKHYVELNSLSDDLAGTNRSIFMWVKSPVNVASSSQMLFSINSASGGNVCLLQIATNEYLEVYDGANAKDSGIDIGDDAWHYVGYTYNDTTNDTKIYVDGVLVKEFTNEQTMAADAQISLGQEFDGGSTGNFFDGQMTEISVWNEVLDATDIATAMQSKIIASHSKYANLVGYYNGFGATAQDTAILEDKSGKGNNGNAMAFTLDYSVTADISNYNATDWYTSQEWYKNGTLQTTATTFSTPAATDNFELKVLRDNITASDTWTTTIVAISETIDDVSDTNICSNNQITYNATTHKVAPFTFSKADQRSVNLKVLQDDLSASDRSVFMWIKSATDVVSEAQMLFSINSNTGGNVSNLQIGTDEHLELFDGSSTHDSGIDLGDNAWHYVGYTYDDSENEAKVYVDGALVKTISNNQDAADTDVYSLGQEFDAGLNKGNFYNGLMTEVSIWKSVLSESDIEAAMKAKIENTHAQYANLVAYYSFPDCGQDTAVLKDWSGNANDGTVIGTVINTAIFDEITDFNAEAWYTKSWQKNDVEFNTASSVNITPSLGTDTYKVVFSRDYITSTDTWDITNNEITIVTQPIDVTVAPNTNATFTSDGGTGVTYQWFNTELGSAVNKTTADGLGSNNCYGVLESNGIIYVANEGGLSISTDGGVTFTNRTTADGLGNNSTRKVYESNGTLYVATASGLSISTDSGTTFTNKTNADGLGTSSTLDVYESNGTIYVATFGGLSISTNGGISFINKTTADGLGNNTCNSVYESNGTLYVGTSGGLSISTDGGNTYTNNSSLGNCKGVYTSNGTLYVASLGGLFISTNGGSSFEHKTETDGLSITYCNDVYESSGTIYVANDAGIDISTDGGTSFTNIMTANGFSEDTYGVLESNGTVYGASTQLGLSIITSKSILNGETNANLTLNNVQLSDDGNEYFVEISNASCTTVSDIATLTVSTVVLKNWTGTTDTSWATNSNWDTNTTPTATDNVIIPNVMNKPVIGASTTALSKNLTIETSSTLTLAGGGALTVSGNFSTADANALVANSGSSVIVTGTATGDVLYKRNLPSTNWYLIASPVNGESVKDFLTAHTFVYGAGTTPSRNTSFAQYKNDGSAWNYYLDGNFDGLNGDDTTDMMAQGQGFTTKFAASGDASFSGTINTASINNRTITQATSNFNAVGNPFTAYLNLGDFFTDNPVPSILSESSAWFWDGSAYQTKTANIDGTFEIAPAQGFFVSAGAASVNTTFDIADISHKSTDVFLRSSDTRPQIKLFISDGTNSRYSRLFYIDNTTTGFDNGYDGTLFGGTTESFSLYTNLVTDSQGQKLAVQVLPPNNYENMIIPIGVNAASGLEIKFTTESLNLPTGIKVFIEDKKTNTFIQIDEVNTNYTVHLSEDLNDIGRFYLHTTSSTLNINTDLLENVSIYKSDKSTLRIVGLTEGKTQIKIFSVLGKEVLKTNFQSSGNVKDIALSKIAPGIYIVDLKTATGKFAQKIIIEKVRIFKRNTMKNR
ncbi:LamG-like jellyroll fold domain-containing protein [Polaribacter sp.]|uniref:LamG-like jellyroll fold domain-containing protein n=1 Tax=Polaribacter sp. TaxID=1920175 RepID=UPI003EF6F5E3